VKVLLGANVAPSGGVATHILRVAEGVEKLGANVDVLWGTPTRRWVPGPAAGLRFSQALARAAASGQYDIVAAQGGEGALLAPGGPGRVVTSHGDPRDGWKALLVYAPVPRRERFVTPYVGLPLFRRSIRRADVVVALHEREAVKFRAERRQDPSTVHIVPNGCGALHAAAEAVPGNIVFLGNWLPRKGSYIIPEIFRLVRQANPNASLTLVGADPSAEAQFREEDRIHVRALGFVDPSEAERVLRSSDVLLLPSFIEGMPLAVLEAMSFGVPTVGFDIAGTAAAAGRAGVLVAPGDVDGCAQALVRVTGDRRLRRQLSREAFARAQRLTWAATAERTLEAYVHAARISKSR
jgi:glycosyltransferase involved in cell wall biosynthesis